MTRALYRAGRPDVPLLDGNAMPRGSSPAAKQGRELIGALLTDPASQARVHRPLYATHEEYDQLVAERMRTMTLAERIDLEIRLTERFNRSHTYDYDPLKY
jgi:hypothetical protein